jgi:hypothetical protein
MYQWKIMGKTVTQEMIEAGGEAVLWLLPDECSLSFAESLAEAVLRAAFEQEEKK